MYLYTYIFVYLQYTYIYIHYVLYICVYSYAWIHTYISIYDYICSEFHSVVKTKMHLHDRQVKYGSEYTFLIQDLLRIRMALIVSVYVHGP